MLPIMIIFLSSDGPGDMVTDGVGDGEDTGTAKSGSVNTTDTTEGINYLSLSIFSKVERGLSFYHFSLFSLFFFLLLSMLIWYLLIWLQDISNTAMHVLSQIHFSDQKLIEKVKHLLL